MEQLIYNILNILIATIYLPILITVLCVVVFGIMPKEVQNGNNI